MAARHLLKAALHPKSATTAATSHSSRYIAPLPSFRPGATAGLASSSSSRQAHFTPTPWFKASTAGSRLLCLLQSPGSRLLRPAVQHPTQPWATAVRSSGQCVTHPYAASTPLSLLRYTSRCSTSRFSTSTSSCGRTSTTSSSSISRGSGRSAATTTAASSSSSSASARPSGGGPPPPRGPSRQGYGGKVAIPSQELLQQPLLSTSATVRARAYHIGWHIHIGKLAEHARRAYRCRTQAGKDYVLIWVPPRLLQQQGPAWQPYLARGSERYTPREPGQRLAEQAAQAPAAGTSSSSSASSSAASKLPPAASKPSRPGGMPTSTLPAEHSPEAAAAAAVAGQQQDTLNVMVAYRYGSVVFLRCPAGAVEGDTEVLQRLLQPSMIYHDRSLGRGRGVAGGGSSGGWPGWLLRWYHGAPALGTATHQQELVQVGADPRTSWAHRHGPTPSYQRYKAGLWQGNLWGLSRHWGRLKERAAQLGVDLLQPAAGRAGAAVLLPVGPMAQAEAALKQATAAATAAASRKPMQSPLQQPQPPEEERMAELSAQLRLEPSVEEHVVVVDPRAAAAVAPGVNCLRLRVLDVGNTRVISSLLAQSVALDWYNRSVSAALEAFQAMRLRGAGRLGQVSPSTWRDVLWRREAPDRMLQQVLANAALVSMTARSSLEMTEPAWQYDAYHDTWRVMAAEFDLDARHAAFGTKLTRLEKEARFDVKWRHGQRYQNLSRAVELLLMFSVMLALWKAGVTFLEHLANWTRDYDGLGSEEGEEEEEGEEGVATASTDVEQQQ